MLATCHGRVRDRHDLGMYSAGRTPYADPMTAMATELNPLLPSSWEVILAVLGFGVLSALAVVAIVVVAVRRTAPPEPEVADDRP